MQKYSGPVFRANTHVATDESTGRPPRRAEARSLRPPLRSHPLLLPSMLWCPLAALCLTSCQRILAILFF